MSFFRQALAGLRALVVFTVICGLAYPMAMVLAGRVFPGTSGSLVSVDQTVVGSTLSGQAAGPQWFQARPSASDYSGATSGGSNLSPTSDALATAMATRRAALVAANPDAVSDVPAEALTASASGLDPDISPAYALWQVPRVAASRGLSVEQVRALVEAHTRTAFLGFIGTDTVNTVELNVALASLAR